MLKQRIITALVLAAVFLGALFVPSPLPWFVFVSVMVLVGWWEWIRLSQLKLVSPVVIGASAMLLLLAYTFYRLNFSGLIVCFSAALWLVLIVSALQRGTNASSLLWRPLTKLLIGVWVLAFTWWALIWLHDRTDSAPLILSVFMVIWVADVGAYFSGKRFGNRKLAPHVSPGKTFAGLYGGLLAVTVYALIVIAALGFPQGGLILLFGAPVIAFISVGGDLYESLLKRQANMKDSSHVLPGHGGVLDRVDSLLAALPFIIIAYAWSQAGV